jgi:GNAT superfamily N-acetyltransferase/predicted ATP-grasp superfamily ATP-dependent carboligase
MKNIEFRKAVAEDAPDIVRLINGAFRPKPGAEVWTSEANLVRGDRINLSQVADAIAQESSAFLLALLSGKIVACYHVDGRKPQAYIGLFAVDPALQKMGIGDAIRKYVEEYASSVFASTSFTLLVLAPRKELIAFNKRRGFQPTGREYRYPKSLGIGEPVDANLTMIEMYKRSDYFPKRTLKILFSHRKDWETAIEKAFKGSRHEVVFDDLSENVLSGFDLVIPLTIPDIKYLNTVRYLISNNPIPVPSMECVLLCDDKLMFNEALVKNGFGGLVPRMRGNLDYPYVLKKRIDEWGSNTHIIRNAEDENKLSHLISSPDYFCQICIPGSSQYATHILFKDGRIINSLSFRFYYENDIPVQGRDKIISREVFDCPYLSVFYSIIVLIGFEGICCIDYKVIGGRPYILEINPRIGGSLCSLLPDFLEAAI